jgi:hypothetical protein
MHCEAFRRAELWHYDIYDADYVENYEMMRRKGGGGGKMMMMINMARMDYGANDVMAGG